MSSALLELPQCQD